MARGVKGSGVQTAGTPMTSEDILAAEARIEGKRAPLHEEDFDELTEKMASRKILNTADGRQIAQVGSFKQTQVFGDSQTLKKFARIEPDWSDWIPCTNEEALLYQDLRVMIGHDGDKRLALIDERKLARVKKEGKSGLLPDIQMKALKSLEEIQ